MAKLFTIIENDLGKWSAELKQIRELITSGETSRDGDDFREARKKIAGLLDDIRETRVYVAHEQSKALGIAALTVDAETWFEVDQSATPPDALPANQRPQDECSPE